MGQTIRYAYAGLAFAAILVGLYGTTSVVPDAEYVLAQVKHNIPDDQPQQVQGGGGGQKI